jgi:enamine deaminase RidA (YjgF/YER057c/UK114 family)
MRKKVSAKTPLAAEVGYSRAVRAGAIVAVSGTVGADAAGRASAPNAYGQAKAAIEKIRAALAECGSGLSDVVRTRMFVVGADNVSQVVKAHGEYFRGIEPASTVVLISGLIEPQFFVEIEADAVVPERLKRPSRRSVLRTDIAGVPRAAARVAGGRREKGEEKKK